MISTFFRKLGLKLPSTGSKTRFLPFLTSFYFYTFLVILFSVLHYLLHLVYRIPFRCAPSRLSNNLDSLISLTFSIDSLSLNKTTSCHKRINRLNHFLILIYQTYLFLCTLIISLRSSLHSHTPQIRITSTIHPHRFCHYGHLFTLHQRDGIQASTPPLQSSSPLPYTIASIPLTHLHSHPHTYIHIYLQMRLTHRTHHTVFTDQTHV